MLTKVLCVDDIKYNYISVCYEKYEMLSMSVRSYTNATSGIVDFLSKDNILTSAPLVDGCFNGLSKSLW